MKLYFIRHGIAADKGNYPQDEDRPLTDKGEKKTRQVAERLREIDATFDLILTSPLLRAHQTALILQEMGLTPAVKISTSLAPGGDIHNWLSWLSQWRSEGGTDLGLVGHQPDLGDWAQILIWGEVASATPDGVREPIVLKKAGILGLNLPHSGDPVGNSELFWLTSPKLLLGESGIK
ncbi:MAG TPA: phosphohistidine phosphatase SixA [Oscillatoriaceae cyanobacterium M33_DOE_052]|nr:phosphohistidine phosphatase SixA [Oscillatoriaceae cyanobacterium M33_DOE_052]